MSLRSAFRASQSTAEDELLKEKLNYKSSSTKKGDTYVWAPIGKFCNCDIGISKNM